MRGIYFLYVFIIFSFCSYAQEDSTINALNPEYRFAHKGVADGLSPGAVNDFYKEENGFLWIATTSGLNRYDGYEFQHYSPKSSNPSAIQSRNFRRVFKGPLGNIWCETPEGINILKLISSSSLAITRCGASTTAELAHTLTPFIAVPLPNSIDNHQYLNAKYYENEGCCWLLEQDNFSTENLFNLIMETIKNKNKLENIRKNMKKNYNKNVYSNIENEIKEFI